MGLLVGILVASLGFTVLTAAATTSHLRVTGTVSAAARPAYDILVRPSGAATDLELTRGLIQDNHLSGTFGGITEGQYRSIRRVPGVEVAAPVANLGYVLLRQPVIIDVRDLLDGSDIELLRLRPAYVAHGGRTRHADADHYLYFARRDPFIAGPGGPAQLVGDRLVDVCAGYPATAERSRFDTAFDPAARSTLWCVSAQSPEAPRVHGDAPAAPPGSVGIALEIAFPVLVTAIDPEQEARLVSLPDTLVEGRHLGPADAPQDRAVGGPVVPVLASTRSYLDEHLVVQVERLAAPDDGSVARRLGGSGARTFLHAAGGTFVGARTVSLDDAYHRLLDGISARPQEIGDYWTAGPVRYTDQPDGSLAARTVVNSAQTWATPTSRFVFSAPVDNTDTAVRALTVRQATGCRRGCAGVRPPPLIQVVGRFDPDRLAGFDPRSEVPLHSYRPPVVVPADGPSRRALADRPLEPDRNLGGYVAQPPALLTTLSAASAFTHSRLPIDPAVAAPISAIRVRVADVRGVDPVSRERVRQVALAIHDRTGLEVDITVGSSPAPQLVRLPATAHGLPPLLVREGWVKKGVAVQLLHASDRKSLLLFGLILLVCALFVGNAATAAVRARRTELGTLRCLGWSTAHVVTVTLAELALVGLLAGGAGSLLAIPLAHALDLAASPARAATAVPVAVLVALGAGLAAGWRASRALPVDAVRGGVLPCRRSWSPHGLLGLAGTNLLRVPARAAISVGGLAIGVAMLTVLFAVTRAFDGIVVGSLLGEAVAVRVRGVDYVAAVATTLLGGVSLADVLLLNMRERTAEFATLRACGWDDRTLARLVATEGVAIGTAGSALGVAVGLGTAAALGGTGYAALLPAAAAAALAGILVTVVASVVPRARIGTVSRAAVLAQE